MTLPTWTSALREETERVGWVWLEDDTSATVRADWLDAWSRLVFEAEFHERCRARLARCVPLAVGPTRERRLSKTPSRMTLVFDPERPELVCTSLSHAIPSLAWSLAVPTAWAATASVYLTEEAPRRASFSRVTRLVKPTGGHDLGAIEQALDAVELWIDDAFWGSRDDDDPWLALPRHLDVLAVAQHVRRAREQDAARWPTLSARTLWSRSTLSIERHPQKLLAFELRYHPARDELAMAALAEATGVRLPLDLPLDLAASLLHGVTFTSERVSELLAHDEPPVEALALRCALAPSTATTLRHLTEAIATTRDSRRLGALAGLASSYRHEGLLFEVLARAEGRLRSELEAFLRPDAQGST